MKKDKAKQQIQKKPKSTLTRCKQRSVQMCHFCTQSSEVDEQIFSAIFDDAACFQNKNSGGFFSMRLLMSWPAPTASPAIVKAANIEPIISLVFERCFEMS